MQNACKQQNLKSVCKLAKFAWYSSPGGGVGCTHTLHHPWLCPRLWTGWTQRH